MELSELLKKSGALAKFQVAAATNSKTNNDPIEGQRAKFCEAVGYQLEALDADIAGTSFNKTATIKNKDTRLQEEKQLRFKRWWIKDGNRYLVVLRYGASPLFAQAIIAANLDGVKTVLDGVIEAARAGHLDEQFKHFRRGKRVSKNGTNGSPVLRNIKSHT